MTLPIKIRGSIMKYQVQENCLTIYLPQEVDHHNAEEIKRDADRLIDRNHIRYVIFDFEETLFCDSSGIGVIMGRYKKILFNRGKVIVINVDNRVDRIMRMSGLYKIVESCSSLDNALKILENK